MRRWVAIPAVIAMIALAACSGPQGPSGPAGVIESGVMRAVKWPERYAFFLNRRGSVAASAQEVADALLMSLPCRQNYADSLAARILM
jgi:hypothetical protein